LIDQDAEEALAHAMAARRLASRIAAVREAVGLAAYAGGEWQTAIAELRTYHRMSGKQTHLAVLADCERGMGRPERAVDLFRGADRAGLDQAEALELLIVAAGARGDLGQHDAAVAMLQVRELSGGETEPWAARLRYAYADALLAAGRREEAREWFARAAEADVDAATDATERLLELDGVTLDEAEPDEDDEDLPEEDGVATGTNALLDDDVEDELEARGDDVAAGGSGRAAHDGGAGLPTTEPVGDEPVDDEDPEDLPFDDEDAAVEEEAATADDAKADGDFGADAEDKHLPSDEFRPEDGHRASPTDGPDRPGTASA
jgi:tetratricopeptide (TPR) repeat protein